MCRVLERIDRAMSSTPFPVLRERLSGTISHSGSWPIAPSWNGAHDLHFACEDVRIRHDEGDIDDTHRYERRLEAEHTLAHPSTLELSDAGHMRGDLDRELGPQTLSELDGTGRTTPRADGRHCGNRSEDMDEGRDVGTGRCRRTGRPLWRRGTPGWGGRCLVRGIA
jgi:hypothetical protein